MDTTSSVIAALDAGKLPSQRQLNAFMDWVILNIIPYGSPEFDKLSQPGTAIARGLADVLVAYKHLGANKNCTSPIFHPPCLADSTLQTTM